MAGGKTCSGEKLYVQNSLVEVCFPPENKGLIISLDTVTFQVQYLALLLASDIKGTAFFFENMFSVFFSSVTSFFL